MHEGCITSNASALWMVPTRCIRGVSSPLIKVPGSRWLESGRFFSTSDSAGPVQAVAGVGGGLACAGGCVRIPLSTGKVAGGKLTSRPRPSPAAYGQFLGRSDLLNPADGGRSHSTPTTSPLANFIGLDREGFRDSADRVYLTPDDQPVCEYALQTRRSETPPAGPFLTERLGRGRKATVRCGREFCAQAPEGSRPALRGLTAFTAATDLGGAKPFKVFRA
ncbi:hypothetical protein Bbelb_118160 [Branchiostoma belcheri]|nr:hypothetical protein Bbelb_118160 [Branchiostoma belcheri]